MSVQVTLDISNFAISNIAGDAKKCRICQALIKAENRNASILVIGDRSRKYVDCT